MSDMQPPLNAALEPALRRRNRWLTGIVVATVAIAGVGVGIALANRDDTPTQFGASNSQVAALNQACNNWVDVDRPRSTPGAWCDDMTGWMNQQLANGSMRHEMMWGDPDQMVTTCQSSMEANPSADRPSDWCDNMVTGMWQHMGNVWDHRADWDDWMGDHPMMGG